MASLCGRILDSAAPPGDFTSPAFRFRNFGLRVRSCCEVDCLGFSCRVHRRRVWRKSRLLAVLTEALYVLLASWPYKCDASLHLKVWLAVLEQAMQVCSASDKVWLFGWLVLGWPSSMILAAVTVSEALKHGRSSHDIAAPEASVGRRTFRGAICIESCTYSASVALCLESSSFHVKPAKPLSQRKALRPLAARLESILRVSLHLQGTVLPPHSQRSGYNDQHA